MRRSNYSEIKYYPIIECDSDGGVKVPMMATLNVEDVKRNHKLWLQEVVPNTFRLCSTDEGTERLKNVFVVNCPLCGDELQMIAEGTSKNKHGLYVCRSCKR